MFAKENSGFQNLTFLINVGSNLKMSVTIEFYVPNGTLSKFYTTIVLYFHTVTLFYLNLTLTSA